MKVDTRPANGEDVDWLADVFTRSMREAITAARGSWDFEREDAQFRAQLQIADTRVIRVEGTDVGLVTVRALDGKLLEVHTLCVQPARQGAGVGARIMQDVMIAARTAGSAVELSVLKSNSRAEHFYARLGFAKIGASTHHIRMRWPVAEED
jgi:ribosomal-protein-alanine N-acetyltransferase